MSTPIFQGLCSAFFAYLQSDLTDDIGSFTVTDIQLHILLEKLGTNTVDSRTYTQAINSPHAEKWRKAMESESSTFESDL